MAKSAGYSLIARELAIFLGITFLGYLLFADGSKNVRYPLSARPEIKTRFVEIGRFVMLLGYLALALLRFSLWKLRHRA